MAPRQVLAFQIGCWTAFVTAALHLAGHVAGMQPVTPDEVRVIAAASEAVLALPGATRSILDLFDGFSLTFTLFLAFWGGLGLMILRRGRDDADLMYAVARTMAGAGVVLLVISLSYWFLIPSLCAAMIAVSFGVASVRAPAA